MSQSRQRPLRLALLNCEDLFLFMDLWQGQDLEHLNEKEWQALSTSPTPSKKLSKTKWLASTLREIDADIFMLNEVGGEESLSNFSRHFLKGTHQPYLIEGNSDRGIDVGYLVRRTLPGKFLLLSHRHHPLNFVAANDSPERPKTHYFSRDALELRWFDVEGQSPKLVFLLVHLKSKLDPHGFDPRGQRRRQAECEALVEIYQSLRRELPQTPVVVAGDFNGQAAGPNPDPEFQSLLKTDLVETFQILNVPLEASASQVNIDRNHNVQLLKIDHVFVSPELREKVVAEGSGVFLYRGDMGLPLPFARSLESRQALPSDHYPLVVNITVSSTS